MRSERKQLNFWYFIVSIYCIQELELEKTSVLSMTLNCIRWWGSSSEECGVSSLLPWLSGPFWLYLCIDIQIDLFENY